MTDPSLALLLPSALALAVWALDWCDRTYHAYHGSTYLRALHCARNRASLSS
jgi:hypothetical protein